jgi:hypothetical protein
LGTRSRIGLELPNGNIYSVYHHWDGYPEWLGRILKQHYNTDAAVKKLIDGGDMSSCYSDTGWDYDEKRDPQPCYYSERGEDCPPRTDATIQEYFANANSWEEYCYIYTTFGEWLCFEIDKKYNEDYSEIVETITRPREIPADVEKATAGAVNS